MIGVTFTVRQSSEHDLLMEKVQHRAQLPEATQSMQKKILVTMLVRNLRHLLQKLFRIPASRQQLFLLQNQSDDQVLVMDISDDLRDLKFYGVSEGDEITILLDQ